MSVIDKLNLIEGYKSDIKSALIDKGVDMTNIPLSGYASKINGMSGRTPVVEELNVISNGVYSVGVGVDGYNHIYVNVPQEVVGFTQNDVVNKLIYLSYCESPISVLNPNGMIGFSSGYFPNCTMISANAFNNVSVGSIVIPECISITDAAFYNCKNLSIVDFPNVTSIGNSAFARCTSLKSINLPNCTYFGEDAFYGCGAVETCVLGGLVDTGSPTGLFRDASIISAEFPNATRITRTFIGCRNLERFYGSNIEYIGKETFQYCYKLSTANFPKCSYISYRGFEGCSKLSEVTINNVGYIGNIAFLGCYKLKSVVLDVCSFLGYEAFYDCHSLSKVVLNYDGVCTMERNDVFAYTPMMFSSYLGEFGSIYVPMSLVDAYKSATNWVEFSDRIVGI